MDISELQVQNSLELFTARIDRASARINKMMRYGQIYLYVPIFLAFVLANHVRSFLLLRDIREFINSCQQDCAHINCLSSIREKATLVRDKYVNIYNIVSKWEQSPAILVRSLKNVCWDWDDLVEDCVIGTDPEFHSLIRQIAEKI